MKFLKKWICVAVLLGSVFVQIPNVQASEEQELRNIAKGLPYEWSEEPDAGYPDTGYKLTDGKYGKLDKSDPAWVGHVNKKTREVIFDLGEEKSIASIKAHFLQDYPKSSILVPLTVSMYVSDDKKHWGTLSHNSTKLLWGEGPPRDETFVWDGSKDGIKSGGSNATMAYARYVKVTFSMHPTARTLIDEIEIWGADGKLEGAEAVIPETPEYLRAGDATDGINNLVLLYNGHYPEGKGDWSKERIIPNISYVDKQGEPQDWFYDGVLYLGLQSPDGRDYGKGETILKDWNWYLDKTFGENGDMHQLNEATKEVAEKLNEPNQQEKVVLMIPDPGQSITNFGDVDGDGITESFNAADVGEEKAMENRKKVMNWWVNEVKERWDNGNYSNLKLSGIYWLNEQIEPGNVAPELIKYISNLAHDQHLKFFWIPHFLAYKGHMWKDVGFDASAFQPNYFFGGVKADRLEDAANIAKQYGMGVEIEFDDRMLTDGEFRERYIDYLNSGVKYGYMQNSFKAYYQGNDAIYNSAVSKDPATRILYDWLYQFANGTYEINDEPAPEVDVEMNGKLIESGVKISDSNPVQFTWNVKNDDGKGLTKVTAVFDGKVYEENTPIDLAGKPGKHELVVTVVTGKVKKTTYVIEVGTSAEDMKKLVDRFESSGQFANHGAARALQVHLETLKHFEASGSTDKFKKHLKGLNLLLEQQKKDQLISQKAYDILRTDMYYLFGNLVLNKAAEASSVEGARPELTADKAVDGYNATRWASDYVDNTWYLIDLGEKKEFDTVTIDWEAAYAKKYKILVSKDKIHWTNVIQNNGGIIDGKGGKEVIHFDSVKGRYVKFEGIARATDYGYSFYEFGVYQIGN
ncbi:DUF4855 domain-containing protein [Heyndrickxia sporothermodurans]